LFVSLIVTNYPNAFRGCCQLPPRIRNVFLHILDYLENVFRRDNNRSEGDDVTQEPKDSPPNIEPTVAENVNGNTGDGSNGDTSTVAETSAAAPTSDTNDVIKETIKSPGTPTHDEHANQPIITEQNTDGQNENGAAAAQ